MGFPFETIYEHNEQQLLMEKILTFFGYSVTSVAQNISTFPNKFDLYGNYPTPFNSQTKIRFSTPGAEKTEINIFNCLGQLIFSDTWQSSVGNQFYTLNTANWASGVYFYTFRYNNRILQNKFIIVK